MKKLLITLLTLTLSLLSILSLCSCSSLGLVSEKTDEKTDEETEEEIATKPKVVDEGYIYDWLVDNGQLVNKGTKLVYEDKTNFGKIYTLRYDSSSDDLSFVYTLSNYEGYELSIWIPVFSDNCEAGINLVDGSIWGGVIFNYTRKNFTKNTTIKIERTIRSAPVLKIVTDENGQVTTVTERSQEEIYRMQVLCQEIAHEYLCELLDWIKEDFCPKAGIEMSDLGYLRY